MAFISFVCPVYNKARYLPGVIDALALQARQHRRQFIFIDDGSSDESLEIVRSLTGDWPDCIIRQQENQGPSGATNAGIALAEGDYIKLLGSDDILAPFATDLLLAAAEQTGAVAVFSRQDYYRTGAAMVFADVDPPAPRLMKDALASTIALGISGTSQTLFLAQAVREAGGCDPRVFAEDYSLALRLARFGSFADLDLVTAYGPADEDGRIMVGRKHQVFHDYNLALALFCQDHPELAPAYPRLALRRAAGRAEKWAQREGTGASFLPFWLLRMASYLPGLDHGQLIFSTLTAFEGGRWSRQYPIIRPGRARQADD